MNLYLTITFKNREKLRSVILEYYQSYIEKILYKSVLKMKELSKEGVLNMQL
jgi:hypothetical protein